MLRLYYDKWLSEMKLTYSRRISKQLLISVFCFYRVKKTDKSLLGVHGPGDLEVEKLIYKVAIIYRFIKT
ncbi:Low-affinity glucose transporter HXT3 [Fusarium oxysporum f. sp. albedinis]|nr:Low-affinity glucose transporter HXT3 [Fusarium oxysporum f. sp. albedinis]